MLRILFCFVLHNNGKLEKDLIWGVLQMSILCNIFQHFFTLFHMDHSSYGASDCRNGKSEFQTILYLNSNNSFLKFQKISYILVFLFIIKCLQIMNLIQWCCDIILRSVFLSKWTLLRYNVHTLRLIYFKHRTNEALSKVQYGKINQNKSTYSMLPFV